eukprot:TRINITY_DN2795_c0_g1_i1.p1 TRINITY_DN2795_c0_g1~~TRINITY_DN2795_c0_g1_i1.p1  ORF type:complete len:228 (+),score=40.10 TRINITY_DN2795_c0_g1_i1:413-1096(+)
MADIRLVVLGAGQTGKSALTIQFVQGNFAEIYDSTVEDSYRKTAEVDGNACQLSILDTAGQEEYGAFMKMYYDKGDGFLLVYNVLDGNSFAAVEEIHQKLIASREDLRPAGCPDGCKVPIVVVGNKIDLVGSYDRQVETRDGAEASKEWKCGFFETSAKTRENVETAFHELIRLVKKAQVRKENATQTQPQRKPSRVGSIPPQPSQEDLPPTQPARKKKKKSKCTIL